VRELAREERANRKKGAFSNIFRESIYQLGSVDAGTDEGKARLATFPLPPHSFVWGLEEIKTSEKHAAYTVYEVLITAWNPTIF
jgi:hypothetical protein